MIILTYSFELIFFRNSRHTSYMLYYNNIRHITVYGYKKDGTYRNSITRLKYETHNNILHVYLPQDISHSNEETVSADQHCASKKHITLYI